MHLLCYQMHIKFIFQIKQISYHYIKPTFTPEEEKREKWRKRSSWGRGAGSRGEGYEGASYRQIYIQAFSPLAKER